jgi:hypothetical protein
VSPAANGVQIVQALSSDYRQFGEGTYGACCEVSDSGRKRITREGSESCNSRRDTIRPITLREANARQNCLTRATSSEAQPELAWLVIINGNRDRSTVSLNTDSTRKDEVTSWCWNVSATSALHQISVWGLGSRYIGRGGETS